MYCDVAVLLVSPNSKGKVEVQSSPHFVPTGCKKDGKEYESIATYISFLCSFRALILQPFYNRNIDVHLYTYCKSQLVANKFEVINFVVDSNLSVLITAPVKSLLPAAEVGQILDR